MKPTRMHRIWVLPVLALFLAGLLATPAQALPANQTLAVSFAELGLEAPVSLDGPVAETNLTFNPGPGWVPEGAAALDLDISAYFSSLVAAEDPAAVSGLVGGNLTVSLNGETLQVFTLQSSGDQVLHLDFDAAKLLPPGGQSVNVLRIAWDGTLSCRMNLLSSVVVQPDSVLTFTYQADPSRVELSAFPVPFFTPHALKPAGLKLLVPTQPSEAELRAALILAATIGQQSGGEQPLAVEDLDLYRAGAPAENLLLVAASDRLSGAEVRRVATLVASPAGSGEGELRLFELPSGGFGLLVSGDGQGIVLAAQAAAAGQVSVPSGTRSLLVSAVNPREEAVGGEDATLIDLGAGNILLTRETGLSHSFDFLVPAGQQARADSSFGLIISHSQQLDYLGSGLQVLLNGSPVASIRLNDNTSIQNLFQLILPSTLVHPGRNTIELRADLNLLDVCTAPRADVAWLRVSGDSVLHLPLEKAVAGAAAPRSFADFPALFISGSGLDNVLFLLGAGEPGAVAAAGDLAYSLGAALPRGGPIQLGARWAQDFDGTLPQDTGLVLVGSPAGLPLLAQPGLFPLLAFNPDGTLAPTSGIEYLTRPEGGGETAYLALRALGGGSNSLEGGSNSLEGGSSSVVLAVLGGSREALLEGVKALTGHRLEGSNFAVVSGAGAVSSWMDAGIASGQPPAAAPGEAGLPAAAQPVRAFRRELAVWALPLLAGFALLFLAAGFLELRRRKG